MAKQKKNLYPFPSVSTDTQNDEARKLWYHKMYLSKKGMECDEDEGKGPTCMYVCM